MNNQELELKIKEILAIENFFDMMQEAYSFEKEYQKTKFFKTTKMSLIDVIKNSKLWYTLQFKDIGSKIQELINSLDVDNISRLIDELGSVYAQENSDILSVVQEFKDIIK